MSDTRHITVVSPARPPSTTQPAPLTLRGTGNIVESSALDIAHARRLAVLNSRRVVSLTVVHIRVRMNRPRRLTGCCPYIQQLQNISRSIYQYYFITRTPQMKKWGQISRVYPSKIREKISVLSHIFIRPIICASNTSFRFLIYRTVSESEVFRIRIRWRSQ